MNFLLKPRSLTTLAGLAMLGVSTALAGESVAVPEPVTTDHSQCKHARPDSHAPIGVMRDHTHDKGGFMVSYRYMYMRMDGLGSGSSDVSSSAAFHQGYGAVPLEMDMHMHMVGLMFAPTDWLTLGAMTSYVLKDMENLASPHAMRHGGGHGGGHAVSGQFSHSSEGWGDTSLTGLIRLYDKHQQKVHIGLGLGLPTAKVDAKQGGTFLPYGMQLGSGTWDFLPSLTYIGQSDSFSWGGQIDGEIRLESANSSGYALGNEFGATAWGAWKVNGWLSLSARLGYRYTDTLRNHYNEPHPHMSPTYLQQNYGGHVLDAGVGINYFIRSGFLKGNRLAAEVILPLYQDLNGLQLQQDWGLVLGWQLAF